MIPQINVIILWIISLTIYGIKHGEEKKVKYDFWGHLLLIIIMAIILAYGGFWKVFG